MKVKTHLAVESKFREYPGAVRRKLLNLRRLILETAGEEERVSELEETLKWGEPSYLTKCGSTIRIDWKEKRPDQYAMYFKCTSKLVPAFKTVFEGVFDFEGSRAIVFKLDDPVPESELKRCIKAALVYHVVKNKPQLDL